MKNRVLSIIISGLIILGVLGLTVSVVSNPAGFLQRIAVMVLVGAVIYFIIQRFNRANPRKREQRAFIQAAKKSKKRFMQKDTSPVNKRKSSAGSISSIKKLKKSSKKKSSAHLTVIEGKKGKKKNRASF